AVSFLAGFFAVDLLTFRAGFFVATAFSDPLVVGRMHGRKSLARVGRSEINLAERETAGPHRVVALVVEPLGIDHVFVYGVAHFEALEVENQGHAAAVPEVSTVRAARLIALDHVAL